MRPLTPRQTAVLAYVVAHPGYQLPYAARAMGLPGGDSLNDVAIRLLNNGYVETTRDSGAVLYWPTATGKAALQVVAHV